MVDLKIEGLEDKPLPKQLEISTKKEGAVPFWYKHEAFIYDKDGTLELDFDNTYLHQKTEPFDFNNPQMDPVNLAASLVKFMRSKMGYGLAANQVGIPLSVFVMEGEPAYAVFNPKITYLSEDEDILLDEGCLSYPGLGLKLRRPRYVRARFQDPYGDFVTRRFQDITSRVFQHEYDHLLGVDYTMKVSRMRRDMAFKKWRKKYGRTGLRLPL